MPKNIPGLVQRRYRRPVETTPIIIPPRPLQATPPPIPPAQEENTAAPLPGSKQQFMGNGTTPPAQSQRAGSDEPMAKTPYNRSAVPDTPPYLEPLHTLPGPDEAPQATPSGIHPDVKVLPVARMLVKINGKVVGETRLTKPELSIGRRDGNDIHVAHPGVSRLHARICAEEGTWVIEDANSANGMRYHGQQIKRLTLNNGDIVMIAPNVALVYETTP